MTSSCLRAGQYRLLHGLSGTGRDGRRGRGRGGAGREAAWQGRVDDGSQLILRGLVEEAVGLKQRREDLRGRGEGDGTRNKVLRN
jgi:hypothetical protein